MVASLRNEGSWVFCDVCSFSTSMVTSIWRSINKFYKNQKLQMCTCKVSFYVCQLTHSQEKAKLFSSKGSNIVFIHSLDISKRTRVACVCVCVQDCTWFTIKYSKYPFLYCILFLFLTCKYEWEALANNSQIYPIYQGCMKWHNI